MYNNDGLITALAMQIAEMRSQIDTIQEQLESYSGDSGSSIVMDDVGGGGGGSHMGNTDDSEEIDGDVTFESADDSNVKVTTEKRTEDDEEVNVIKIGVYYV